MTPRGLEREAAASLAAEAGIAIEHVSKEAIVAKVLEQRGEHPGLVHVISAMEACDAYNLEMICTGCALASKREAAAWDA